MAVKYSNNASTTLSANLTSSATSIAVASVSDFPTLTGSDYTYVTLENLSASTREIVKVTAISGTTLTIVRGQDGTSGQAFSSGDKCELRLTAALLSDLTDEGNEVADDTTPQLGGDLDANRHQIQWSKGNDVASAAALPVLTDGNYFDVTGTTTITSINTTGGAGTLIKLHFDDELILTHDATDLILPGGANITTAAGDEAEFVEYDTGDYRCTNYLRANGEAVVGAVVGGAVAMAIALG